MHSRVVVETALRLRDEHGLGARRVARQLGLLLATVRDWHAGRLPHSYLPHDSNGRRMGPHACHRCGGNKHDFDELGGDYVHLLGLYLGDGSIAKHRRQVYRLRITLDVRYSGIVEECEASMRAVVPKNRVGRQLRDCNCYDVYAYSKGWPCLFPQHGRGKKHERPIFLSEWQRKLAIRWPQQMLRGLIQSDGCRSYSTGRGGWTQPRYVFSNVSTDITSIFCSACDCLGLRWTASFPTNESAAVSIYVSRKADVARLDEFVGPKR